MYFIVYVHFVGVLKILRMLLYAKRTERTVSRFDYCVFANQDTNCPLTRIWTQPNSTTAAATTTSTNARAKGFQHL